MLHVLRFISGIAPGRGEGREWFTEDEFYLDSMQELIYDFL